MIIERTKLLDVLETCLPGVLFKENSIEQGRDLLYFRDGKVSVCNDFIAVSLPVEVDGLFTEKVRGAVRIQEFYKIIKKVKGEVINFSIIGNEWVLKIGKASIKLILVANPQEERLNKIKVNPDKWQVLPDNFMTGLGVCRLNENKSSLSGVFIHEGQMVSSDGYQLHRYKFSDAFNFKDMWFSDNAVGELLKCEKFVEIQQDDLWVHFKGVSGMIFSVLSFSVDAFPYNRLLPLFEKYEGAAGERFHFPRDIYDAVDRASAFAFEAYGKNVVRIELRPEFIKVDAFKDTGVYEEFVEWEKEDDGCLVTPITFFIDANMFLFMQKRANTFFCTQESGVARLIFETDCSLHIMATINKDSIKALENEKEEETGSKMKDITKQARELRERKEAREAQEKDDDEDEE